jgi:hypothetical protein
MQYIADELFVGNKLSTAQLSFSNGTRIDLRHIRSPIVVFCSKADNITPPQQALDWILDLYDSIDDIRAHGQTIVYAVHESIGHLGIFVSGSVAKKEHDEFASNIDLIDSLPPGLYEVVMTAKDSAAPGADLIAGNYLVRFEARTLDDIRALGVNSREDDREFAAAARVSDINLGLYRTFVRPWVRLWANEGVAEWMRRFHPLRMQYEIFSNANPFLNAVLSNERLLGSRQRVSKDNIFWQAQEQFSDGVTSALDTFRDLRDNMVEAWFHAVYGSPLLQALVGLSASDESPLRKPGDDATHHALVLQKIEELKRRIPDGGPREALIRALLYVRMPDAAVDERGFNLLRQMREDAGKGLDLAAFKRVVREQFLMLLLDERRAVSAIPAMLATNSDLAARTKPKFDRMIELFGVHSKAARARLAEVEALLECEDAEPVTTNQPNIVPPAREVRRPRHH